MYGGTTVSPLNGVEIIGDEYVKVSPSTASPVNWFPSCVIQFLASREQMSTHPSYGTDKRPESGYH